MHRRGLSPEQVDEAVRLYQAGWSSRVLAIGSASTRAPCEAAFANEEVSTRDSHGRPRHQDRHGAQIAVT
jgi:hypothetical protein